ncbi:universal stress protein [Halovivax sp.]|uniref:universal stress protein n=1 Tax=Halovivax sp. TaxID=1935978 RepID=UPI0025BAB474|nr:universal stress protein [Halovivax sp.]
MSTRHVLVPIDGSAGAWTALDHAIETFERGRVTTLTVVDPVAELSEDASPGDAQRRTQGGDLDRAAALGERARERIADTGGDEFEHDHEVMIGRPARAIVDYATDHDVDHVVVGSHGRTGLSRILLGSVAETVSRRSPVTVTIVR